MNGISDSLIASILYATGKKLYWQFRNPLKKAIENTIVYFHQEKGIELDERSFEELLNGDIAEKELNVFKKGERFLDGKELALQFAIFSGFYHENENEILNISYEIFDYFKASFTNELLSNPSDAIKNLNNIIGIHFNISTAEHENIRKDIVSLKKSLEQKLDSLNTNVQILVKKSKEDEEQKQIEETIRIKYADYKIVDLDFWEKIRQETDKKPLIYSKTCMVLK